MRGHAAALLVLALVTSGCALLSRGEGLQVRYYEPQPPRHVERIGASPACALQLGDVVASDNLGQNIAFRRSPYELGYYETRRWNEAPDAYLRRALVRALFDEHVCRRILSGDGPTLEARLLAFEEQRGTTPRAWVSVHVILHDGHGAMAEATFDAARPLGAEREDTGFEEFVAAISQALDDVVERVVELVLSTPAPARTDGSPVR